MRRDNLLANRSSDSRDTVEAEGSTAQHADADLDGGFSPYRLLHQYLRGRYLLALVLGLMLASVLGFMGWRSTKPLYRSEGLIRVAYEVPRVMQANQEYRPMDVFLAFMQSQQALITSHRILSVALQNPLWKANGYTMNAAAIDGFAGDLKVEYKGGEHLKLIYESDDPRFAATAVQSIVAAYVQLYNSTDKQATGEKTGALSARRDDLLKKMEAMDVELRSKSVEFGSSNVDRFYEAAVSQLTRVESSLIDVRIALALTDGKRGGQTHFSPQQMARFDPTMARYLADRENLETDLQQLRLRGYGEEHKQVIATKKTLELTVARIQDYAADFQDTRPTPNNGVNGAAPQAASGSLMGRSSEDLRIDEANLLTLNKDVKEKVAALGAQKLGLEAMRAGQGKLKDEYAAVTETLAIMQLESGISGRLSVMSNGEVPLLPTRDRRIHLAGAGAMAGMFLPAAGLVGYGMTKRRYRFSGDASDDLAGEIPLLGILPQLPARLTDPEIAADAAQCLHQIRVMLQVQQPGQGPVVYLLTSACPGEGKTSLCAALSLSFAAAGARTLVVDADLIGQRLTRGYRLDDKPGFREAIQHGAVAPSYYESGVERLSILPAGNSDGRDACAVSSKTIKKLMSSMREDFDVILIDSGPILGSLEAMVVAQHVDGVVLTISREQQKPLVDRAIRQLRSVHARIAGMVFNKAESADFKRSVGASSLRSISRNPESSALVKAGVASTSGFGSLVDSVQTYMPTASSSQ